MSTSHGCSIDWKIMRGCLDSLSDAWAPLCCVAYMALVFIVAAWAEKAWSHVVQEINVVASSDGAVLRLGHPPGCHVWPSRME